MDAQLHLRPLLNVCTKKVVMYSPWPDESFLDDAEQYVTAAQNRSGRVDDRGRSLGKPHKAQNAGKRYHLRKAGSGLDDLQPGDRLYIMGHGIQFEDPAMIKGDFAWNGPVQAGYSSHEAKGIRYPALTPTQLLDKLTDEGLRLFLVTDVRLWVCRSGDKGDTTFAWEFTDLITNLNPKVIVTAYRGFMLFRKYSGEKRGNEQRNNDESKPAKDFKVVINPPKVQPSQVVFRPLCLDTDDLDYPTYEFNASDYL